LQRDSIEISETELSQRASSSSRASTAEEDPSIIAELERRERLPSVISSDCVTREETKKAAHIKISMSKILPYLFGGQKDVVTNAVSNDAIAKSTILAHSEPNNLLSSSTYSLYSQSPSPPADEIVQEKRDSPPLEPFLRAALRADFTAGNPFMRYLKESKANPAIISYLLFWQSVENILTQDEMRRWYNAWKNITDEKEEDEASLSPYLSYFEPYLVAKNLKELCMYFLQSKSLHRVELPQNVVEGLVLLLPKGLGQGLLLAAQEQVVKVKERGGDMCILSHLQC
jgi:hypothetical protein